MAAGFPLRVNGIHIRTSEALYQACRFPHHSAVQRLIIEATSPMTAKMNSKPHRHNTRPDWNRVRIEVMRWCLQIKLAQNWEKFSTLLKETDPRPIVEISHKDAFWGAKVVSEKTLMGKNVLGCLLMELRDAIKISSRNSFFRIEPLAIPDFWLMGQQIQPVVIGDVTEYIPIQVTSSFTSKAKTMQTSMLYYNGE